jgi:antitoxin VapB
MLPREHAGQPRFDAGAEVFTFVCMALSIKAPEADRLARELAKQTGETLTETIVTALRERLARQRRRKAAPGRLARLRALRESMRALPVSDTPSPEQILGYDETGVPR